MTRQRQPLSIPLSIDVGCGSGILSIAALKLGAKKVLGVDIDIESVKNSRENADMNGVGEELILGQGSVTEILSGNFQFKSAPLVVANILAPDHHPPVRCGSRRLGRTEWRDHPERNPCPSGRECHRGGRGKGLKRNDQRQMGDWVAISLKR